MTWNTDKAKVTNTEDRNKIKTVTAEQHYLFIYCYARMKHRNIHIINKKISPVRDSERRRHLANVIAIAKAFANWTETLPSSKSRDTKTRTKVRYCSVVSESVVTCQLTLKLAEEIDFENWRISNFNGLVTLTLTLNRVIRHTVVHHSSTSTYIPNFIGIGKTFCGRTDGKEDDWHW